MVRNEVSGQTYRCVTGNATHTVYSRNGLSCPVTGADVLRGSQLSNTLSIAGNLGVLVVWIVVLRLIGYLALKHLHATHKPSRRKQRQLRNL
jgi:hypothetical protein